MKLIVAGQNLFSGHDNFQTIKDYDKATIKLDCKVNDSVYNGSAVLLKYDNKNYIITAAHVARNIRINGYFICVDSINRPHVFDLKKNAFVNKSDWNFHNNADIAAIEIKPKKIDKYLDFHLKKYSIDISHFDLNLNFPMLRSSNVICYGFILVDLSNNNYSPESITANFATIGPKMTKMENYLSYFYFLQLPSIQGLSGGPVFEGGQIGSSNVTHNLMRCIGIMSGTHSDNTGGKISLVTPAYYMKDILK